MNNEFDRMYLSEVIKTYMLILELSMKLENINSTGPILPDLSDT